MFGYSKVWEKLNNIYVWVNIYLFFKNDCPKVTGDDMWISNTSDGICCQSNTLKKNK